MRELTVNEMEQVDGGVVEVVLAVVAAVGAVFAFGYSVGKDMAERDNAR
jgi:lactobin A/cerein 7B family class IIb bacteriocin